MAAWHASLLATWSLLLDLFRLLFFHPRVHEATRVILVPVRIITFTHIRSPMSENFTFAASITRIISLAALEICLF